MKSRDIKFIYSNLSAVMVLNARNPFASTTSVIPFTKMLSREEAAAKVPQFLTFTPSNIDSMMKKLSTQKRVIAPNFNLFKPRYKKGQLLPSYMESLNNRMTITKLSYEMLRANNFYGTSSIYEEKTKGSGEFDMKALKITKTKKGKKKPLFITENRNIYL